MAVVDIKNIIGVNPLKSVSHGPVTVPGSQQPADCYNDASALMNNNKG